MKNKTRIVAAILLSFFFIMGCLNDEKQKNKIDSTEIYLEKGQQITAAVFSALSSKLQNAMEDGGVENALAYCNLNALNIVDSLSAIHQAQIRRVSDRYRNPKDQPNKSEKEIIANYKNELKKGNEIMPKVVPGPAGRPYFYAPIFVNDLCLKCHGTIGEELTQADAALIKKYYPDDLATGYKRGDFRGIWSIGFKE